MINKAKFQVAPKWEQVSVLQPMESSTHGKVDLALNRLQTMERSIRWSRFSGRNIAHGISIPEQSVPEELHPIVRIHTGTILE